MVTIMYVTRIEQQEKRLVISVSKCVAIVVCCWVSAGTLLSGFTSSHKKLTLILGGLLLSGVVTIGTLRYCDHKILGKDVKHSHCNFIMQCNSLV